jgi:hypothetical protein
VGGGRMKKSIIGLLAALTLILAGSMAYALESYADAVAKQKIFVFQEGDTFSSSQMGEMAQKTKADSYNFGTVGGASASQAAAYCQAQSFQSQGQNQCSFSNQASSGFQTGQTSASNH